MPSSRPTSARLAPERARPRQERAVAMRARLVETTRELLATGADPPTTTAIARAASVSIGTVYRYFGDVEAILEELREEAVRDVTAELSMSVGESLGIDDLEASALTIVGTLTTAIERHAPILRHARTADGTPDGLAAVEALLFPLARVLPARHRPDLTASELDDLVFVTIGVTATTCLRIALDRPAGGDRAAMLGTAATMLAAALRPPVGDGSRA